ncbi:MAG TPA: asparagine synthetase B, partial [Niabella sp.]
MHHRGPDGSGIWISDDHKTVFGHNRLSIIDLSLEGNQPMVNGDGDLCITFNGEIYNYLDLKKELVGAGYS